MINKLLDGLINVLYKEFGEDYTYYPNDVEQTFLCPAFKPVFINPSVNLIRPPRYKVEAPCVIHYYPLVDGDKKEINEVANRLFNSVEYVDMGDQLVRGVEMSYSTQDDVLLFSITYKFVVEQVTTPEPFMEDLETPIIKAGEYI